MMLDGSSAILQCGHGPKAVENVRRLRGPSRGRSLQCGHGPKAVENAAGQRPLRRGGENFNAATARRPWRTWASSYRPSSLIGLLQCGHGPKAVENYLLTPRPSAHLPLQCGHGPKAVENAQPRLGERWPCLNFNAATARRPWRTGHEADGAARVADTSMRPRPEGRGERRRPART